MVILPQGDPSRHAGVQAVVKGAGGIEADHAQAVDEEGNGTHPAAPQYRRPHQEQYGTHHAQHGAHSMRDRRPRPQSVIGISPLLPPDSGPALPLHTRYGEGPIFNALIHAYHRALYDAFSGQTGIVRRSVFLCSYYNSPYLKISIQKS